MSRAYIIDPSNDRAATLGLMPGEHWFEARLAKGAPLSVVHTAVIEPRDESGELCGDVQYLVEINGVRRDDWETMTLIGDEIARGEYNHRLADLAYLKAEHGLHEREAVDLTKLAPVAPPVKMYGGLRGGSMAACVPLGVTVIDDIKVEE